MKLAFQIERSNNFCSEFLESQKIVRQEGRGVTLIAKICHLSWPKKFCQYPPPPYVLSIYIIKIKHKRDISMQFVLSYLLSYKEIILSLHKPLIANQKFPISLDKFLFRTVYYTLIEFWHIFGTGLSKVR